MEVLQIEGKLRDPKGSATARRLRREGHIPAVLYSKGKNVSFSLDMPSIKPILYTADFKLAEVNVDGDKYKCYLKAYDLHPVTDEVTHVDFQVLEDGSKIKVYVPIQLVGQSPGVKRGGVLLQRLRNLYIKCLPKDLIDKLEMDISTLKLGDALKVKDLTVPAGIEVLTDEGSPVVRVAVPRVLAKAGADEEDEEGEEGEESAEGGESSGETPAEGGGEE